MSNDSSKKIKITSNLAVDPKTSTVHNLLTGELLKLEDFRRNDGELSFSNESPISQTALSLSPTTVDLCVAKFLTSLSKEDELPIIDNVEAAFPSSSSDNVASVRQFDNASTSFDNVASPSFDDVASVRQFENASTSFDNVASPSFDNVASQFSNGETELHSFDNAETAFASFGNVINNLDTRDKALLAGLRVLKCEIDDGSKFYDVCEIDENIQFCYDIFDLNDQLDFFRSSERPVHDLLNTLEVRRGKIADFQKKRGFADNVAECFVNLFNSKDINLFMTVLNIKL